MEATGHGDTPIIYDVNTDAYHGSFNNETVNKLVKLGAIIVVESDLGQNIQINTRDDFLSGFSAGVNAARQGEGLYMSDYNANVFAFNCGYEHYEYRQKKCKRTPYDEAMGYVCHGFICGETDDIYRQDQ
jgi:hypothetical protein